MLAKPLMMFQRWRVKMIGGMRVGTWMNCIAIVKAGMGGFSFIALTCSVVLAALHALLLSMASVHVHMTFWAWLPKISLVKPDFLKHWIRHSSPLATRNAGVVWCCVVFYVKISKLQDVRSFSDIFWNIWNSEADGLWIILRCTAMQSFHSHILFGAPKVCSWDFLVMMSVVIRFGLFFLPQCLPMLAFFWGFFQLCFGNVLPCFPNLCQPLGLAANGQHRKPESENEQRHSDEHCMHRYFTQNLQAQNIRNAGTAKGVNYVCPPLLWRRGAQSGDVVSLDLLWTFRNGNFEAYKVSDKPYEAFTVLDYRLCCFILQTCFLGILFNFVIFENFYRTSVYVRNILGLFPLVCFVDVASLRSFRTATSLSRKATRKAKDKFLAREARREERRKRVGKEAKIYYTTSINSSGKKTFTGGRNLADTAVYPQRFVTCLFQAWLKARMAAGDLWNVLNA